MPLEQRLEQLERRIARLEERLENLPAWREQIAENRRGLDKLIADVSSLRLAVVTAAISFAGGALLIAAGLVVAFK